MDAPKFPWLALLIMLGGLGVIAGAGLVLLVGGLFFPAVITGPFNPVVTGLVLLLLVGLAFLWLGRLSRNS